jgi:hypothetical protein
VVGKNTVSSAVRFADILRHNNISEKIFGEETMGKIAHYDYPNRYYLPVTGLSMGLSRNFYYALDGTLSSSGLLPDVTVKPANIHEFWKNGNNRLVIRKVMDYLQQDK